MYYMQLNTWLTSRHINEQIAKAFNVSQELNDGRIIFPVYNTSGTFIFNKYRRPPHQIDGAKYTYDKGGVVSLYGYYLAKNYDTILITEGECDALVAWSHGIPAVSSTGGANSFQREWGELFKNKEVILCFDNDEAGAMGMVRALEVVSHAKILFLPDLPSIKDITDYVSSGGNLKELIKKAVRFNDIGDVRDNMSDRQALFQSVRFHQAYISAHTKIRMVGNIRKTELSNTEVQKARTYSCLEIYDFDIRGKRYCPFHEEKTPSFTYYEKTNTCYCFGCGKSVDSIDLYRQKNNCSFKEAIKALTL